MKRIIILFVFLTGFIESIGASTRPFEFYTNILSHIVLSNKKAEKEKKRKLAHKNYKQMYEVFGEMAKAYPKHTKQYVIQNLKKYNKLIYARKWRKVQSSFYEMIWFYVLDLGNAKYIKYLLAGTHLLGEGANSLYYRFPPDKIINESKNIIDNPNRILVRDCFHLLDMVVRHNNISKKDLSKINNLIKIFILKNKNDSELDNIIITDLISQNIPNIRMIVEKNYPDLFTNVVLSNREFLIKEYKKGGFSVNSKEMLLRVLGEHPDKEVIDFFQYVIKNDNDYYPIKKTKSKIVTHKRYIKHIAKQILEKINEKRQNKSE